MNELVTARGRRASLWDRAMEALRLDWEQTKRDLHLGQREVIKISSAPRRSRTQRTQA
jgi:hypothetical protein